MWKCGNVEMWKCKTHKNSMSACTPWGTLGNFYYNFIIYVKT